MGNKVEIKPTVLGRKNAEYQRLRDSGIAEERIDERIAEDAGVFGIKLDDYKGRLAEIGRKTGSGKRAALKEKKGRVQAKHLTVSSFLNEIKTTGNTDLAAFQTSLTELADEAENWVLMTAVGKDEKSGEVLFTINDSGWNDGSNRSNQYSDRPQMVGKSGKHVNHPYLIRTPEPEAETAPEPVEQATG